MKNLLILLILIVFGFATWMIFRVINVKIVKNNLYKNGKKITEKVEGERFLSFFYSDRVGKFLLKFFRGNIFRIVSKINGYYQRTFLSKITSSIKIKQFIKRHEIDMSEFEIPAEGFYSFNEFFIRKLKPGSRVIDYDKNVIVSPADSKLLVVPEIKSGHRFFVKSRPFALQKFLCDKKNSKEYEGGTLLLFRLAPCDYHRFHFPFDCAPSKPKRIMGGLDSVNTITYKMGYCPLVENERQVVFLRDTNFGDVIFVAIGALLVGKIKWTYKAEREQKKGVEAGYFEFGGSSIALLFKKGIVKIEEKFIKNSKENIETIVKMGEKIGVKL
jgi:phosphatidylserine decarboxylase